MDTNQPESKIDELTEKYERASVDSILNKVETVGLAGLGGASEMITRMAQYETIRTVIFDWIEKNFIKDRDFGATDDRSEKETLKKPGAEKLCRLFDTHPIWKMDIESWVMLGKPKDTICMICYIVDNKTGKIIGEGRGAEKVGNKQRDTNKTIKNAEKCSIVDAALYTFMLSEKFTQDDGKAGKTQIEELKRILIRDVSEKRAGSSSTITDLVFLMNVFEQEIHKKRIDTFGELAHMRKVLFENNKYDWSTGKKIT
jgi:hypothetical protein